MNTLSIKLFTIAIIASFFGLTDNASAQYQYGRDRLGWVQIDEVHFNDSSTWTAINNCKAAKLRDRRCSNSRNYNCSPCSEIMHSDHSSYVVLQLMDNYGPLPGAGQRRYVQTYHFRDKKTAVARQKCLLAQSRMPECKSKRFECTPCTVESHTDHSQFDLYELARY